MTANAIRAVSIIGKNNEIIYFDILSSKKLNQSEEVKFQSIVYACLDMFEDNVQEILHSIDKYKVLGYVSCTGTKIVVVCDEYVISTSSNEIEVAKNRELLFAIYNLYCNTCLNPFQNSTQTVMTKFSTGLIRLVNSEDFTK